jgi:hypothetical protein
LGASLAVPRVVLESTATIGIRLQWFAVSAVQSSAVRRVVVAVGVVATSSADGADAELDELLVRVRLLHRDVEP